MLTKRSLTLIVCVLLTALTAAADVKLDVPYVPTPEPVVAKMLDVAKVGPDDLVYDLGCGDGRIVVGAAKRGANAIGYDLNPERLKEARANAKRAGVTDKVDFSQKNLFDVDLSRATVVTMYLLPRVNMELRSTLMQLRPGTRIVSHAFDMGDWKPDQVHDVDGSKVYLWVVPPRRAP